MAELEQIIGASTTAVTSEVPYINGFRPGSKAEKRAIAQERTLTAIIREARAAHPQPKLTSIRYPQRVG